MDCAEPGGNVWKRDCRECEEDGSPCAYLEHEDEGETGYESPGVWVVQGEWGGGGLCD
jgi:hypothetical protein